MLRSSLVSLFLAACGAAPVATCRSNLDCPSDRVCLAGACEIVAPVDSGPRDAAATDANADTSVDARVAPLGETCANPILLAPTVTMPGVIPTADWVGELSDYVDDGDASCSSVGGAVDAFFELERPSVPSDIVITTSPPGRDVILGLDTSCDGTFGWACNDDRNVVSGGTSDVSAAIFVWHFERVFAERLYLMLDGAGPTVRSGSIGVHVEFRPLASSDCSAPLDISGGGVVLGLIAGVAPPDHGQCAAGDPVRGDVAFRVGVAGRPSAIETLTLTSTDFRAGLVLTDAACSTALLCVESVDSRAVVSMPMTKGAEFVIVEGLGDGPGSFLLQYNP